MRLFLIPPKYYWKIHIIKIKCKPENLVNSASSLRTSPIEVHASLNKVLNSSRCWNSLNTIEVSGSMAEDAAIVTIPNYVRTARMLSLENHWPPRQPSLIIVLLLYIKTKKVIQCNRQNLYTPKSTYFKFKVKFRLIIYLEVARLI